MSAIDRGDFFKDAIEVAESIAIEYMFLETLENTNINSELLVNMAKERLNKLLKIERDMYASYHITPDDALIIINVIRDKFKLNPKMSIEEYLLEYPLTFPPHVRVFLKLDSLLLYDCDARYERMADNLPDDVLYNMSEEDIKSQIFKNNMFNLALRYNYYLVFLVFLESYLDNTDGVLTEKIIHLKYMIPYLFTNCESHFISNNFNIKQSLYLNHTMIGDLVKMPRLVQNEVINSFLYNKFLDAIENLLEINNGQFDNKELYVLVMDLVIRSSAIFLDNDLIEESKELLFDQLYETKDSETNSRAIDELFKNYEDTKKDKCLHKYLSLIKRS